MNIIELQKQKLYRLKAQAMLEYSVFVVCAIAALVAMQIYIKRGIEGKLKETSDNIGEQYAPKNTTTDITNTSTSGQTQSDEIVNVAVPGVPGGINDSYGMPIYSTKSTVTSSANTTRSGSENLGEFEDTLFE